MFYENYRFKGHQKEPPNGPNATLQHDGVTDIDKVYLQSQPAGAGSKKVRQLALGRIRSSAQLTLAHLLYAVFFLFFDVFFVFVFAHSPLAC